MNTYTLNHGMTLTPYGRTWLRSLLSGINRRQPLTLELGEYEWAGNLYQRVQQPVLSIPANAGPALLDATNGRYTEAGIVDAAGQTLAVTPLDVEQNQHPGVLEFLRMRVLINPDSSRFNHKIKAPAFANSSCRMVDGVMDCPEISAELNLPAEPDTELATEIPPGWKPPGQQAPDDVEESDPGSLLHPTDSIGVNIGFGSRWGMRVNAGWKLPRTRLFIGMEPGFYLHILKTTRFYHHA